MHLSCMTEPRRKLRRKSARENSKILEHSGGDARQFAAFALF